MRDGSFFGHAHVKIDARGSKEKVDRFHLALLEIDNDWPFAGIGVHNPVKKLCCKKCGGKSYNNPRLSAPDIKRLSQQFGVNIKIKHYGPANHCVVDKDRLEFINPTTKVIERTVTRG